jgi:hypothetical protein
MASFETRRKAVFGTETCLFLQAELQGLWRCRLCGVTSTLDQPSQVCCRQSVPAWSQPPSARAVGQHGLQHLY